MKLTTLAAAVLISSSVLISDVQARPNMTEEQLTKARQTASQLNPPIDFDALLDEANERGVTCKGDLTRRAIIKMCKLDVDNARLDEEYKATGKRIEQIINETKQIANSKLNY